MTDPKKQAALDAVDWLEDLLQRCADTEGEHNEKCRLVRAALSENPRGEGVASPEIKVAFKALEVAMDKKAADKVCDIVLIPIHAERILHFYKALTTAHPPSVEESEVAEIIAAGYCQSKNDTAEIGAFNLRLQFPNGLRIIPSKKEMKDGSI